MARLSLRNIHKSFGETEVLHDISLDVEDGEFLSLVGQSGCGKSTLLRIISGLDEPTSGDVLLDGEPVTQLAPKQRNVAMVFQDYALYPHMTVAENMAMPLVMARLPMGARLPLIRMVSPAARRARPEIDAQVRAVATQLRIEHLLARKPAQLSGGQRQRVALGRALVRNPGLFLMDEPLSNLDAKLRVDVRREISQLHAESGLTFIYVTHDQTEAMTMSNRIALMQTGRILQVGAPNTLYADPANVDVARFIGSPEITMLPMVQRDGALHLGDLRLPLAVPGAGNDVLIGLRPDAMEIGGMPGLVQPNIPQMAVHLTLEKRMVEDLGPELLIHGAFAAEPGVDVRIRAQKGSDYATATALSTMREITVSVDPSRMMVFGADGTRIPGAPQRLAQTAQVMS